MGLSADAIIEKLNLQPHPEGGWYCQTWADDHAPRPHGTAIFFLLKAGESSHWHRVDADEIWHFYAGAPLRLWRAETDFGPKSSAILGPELFDNQLPQLVVPKTHWQAAETTGDWTLVGCTVSPGFQFSGFELAAPGFDIPR